MSQPVETVLREAVKDLLYMSESDEPFEVVLWKDGTVFDSQKLLEHSGRAANSPVEIIALSDFFKDLTKEKDWHGEEEKADVRKFQKLLQLVNENLSNPLVFRVGKTEVDIYIVGKTKNGDWAGVKTKAIERNGPSAGNNGTEVILCNHSN
jgi:hypothetical protein